MRVRPAHLCIPRAESQPETCRPDSYFGMYGSDYHYASYATMLGEYKYNDRLTDYSLAHVEDVRAKHQEHLAELEAGGR